MKEHDFNFEELPEKNSWRHHYIPQFFLEGFTNEDQLLFIYDKDKDRILDNQRPTKSVFFEKDRNTLRLTELLESSIIEDKLYSLVDTESSKVINYFRNTELKEIDFNSDNTAQFQFFLITLFWRIPKSDFASEDVIDRLEITSPNIDPEVLRNDPVFRKMQRALFADHHIKEIVNFGRKGKFFVNIHQPPQDIFVIGDNPMLYRRTPKLFSEFNEIDFMIAVSSNRIYSSTNQIFAPKTQQNWVNYNAAIIDQSTKYVASGNLDILKKSIEYYKELKKHGLHFELAEQTFKTN